MLFPQLPAAACPAADEHWRRQPAGAGAGRVCGGERPRPAPPPRAPRRRWRQPHSAGPGQRPATYHTATQVSTVCSPGSRESVSELKVMLSH